MGRAAWCRVAGEAAAGALLVFALLEASGLVPVSVTARRATFLVYQYAPVSGSWLLDSLLAGGLGAVAVSCLAGGGAAGAGYLLSAAAAGLALGAAPGPVGDVVVAALAVGALAAAARVEPLLWRRRGFAVGAAVAVAVVEALLVAAVAAYFADPRLAWVAQRLVLVERRLWALPAVAAPVLAAVFGAMWLLCLLRRFYPAAPCPLGLAAGRGCGGGGLGGLGLVAAWLLVAAAVALPHLPTVNPRGEPVSVDTFYYSRFLEAADVHGLGWALAATHGLARAVYLALLYAVHRLLRLDPWLLMDVVHPLVAGAALAAAAYAVAERRLGGCGGEAALLAAAGGQYATFLLSGLQANSAALPLALLYFVADGAALAALMFAAAMIHPWTHLVYSAALVYDRLMRGDRGGAARAAGLAGAAFAASDIANRLLASAPAAPIVAHTLSSGFAGAEPLKGLLWGTLLWSWGSLASSPWVAAAGAAAPFYTPAAAVEAVAAPPAALAGRVTAHRLLLDVPFWLPAALVARRLPRSLRLALLLAAVGGLMVAVYYATPLEGPLWESIWRRLVEPGG